MVEKRNKMEVSNTLVAVNSFPVTIHIDGVIKVRGALNMTELCVCQVKVGKIISEEFHL